MKRFAPNHSRRGVTIIEMLVAIAMLVVVIGLTLGIVIQTEKASSQLTRRMSMATDCQTILNDMCQALSRAADPAQFDGIENAEAIAPVFAADSISLPTLSQGRELTLNMMTLGTILDEEGATRATIHYRPMADDAPVGKHRQLGQTPDRYDLTVSFAYAAAPQPGAGPDYHDTWDGQGLPALIRVKVEGVADGNDVPFKLQTSVIPGMLPGSPPATPPAAAPAAPTPAEETQS